MSGDTRTAMNPMEEEAARRMARLQALRLPRKEASNGAADNLQAIHQALRLRNYKQVVERETRLTSRREARPTDNDDDPHSNTMQQPQDTIESSVSGIVENALANRQEDIAGDELDITAIAPKRANWDLKRDLQKRLEELKYRNEVAVADIIRKRIQESGSTVDLATAVEAQLHGITM